MGKNILFPILITLIIGLLLWLMGKIWVIYLIIGVSIAIWQLNKYRSRQRDRYQRSDLQTGTQELRKKDGEVGREANADFGQYERQRAANPKEVDGALADRNKETAGSEDDDPVRDLLRLCESDPKEGLAWIDRLDNDVRSKALTMFAGFIAFRKLAFQSYLEGGPRSLSSEDAASLERYFNEERLDFAEAALQQVAEIEKAYPDYIEGLGDPTDRFGVMMVDDVCIVLQRLRPDRPRTILGWTKLRFLEGECIGSLPDFIKSASKPLLKRVLDVKFSSPKAVTSAIGVSSSEKADGTRSATFYLCRLDTRYTATIGDAEMFGNVELFEDGRAEFRSTE
jgi:hypothetical protein